MQIIPIWEEELPLSYFFFNLICKNYYSLLNYNWLLLIDDDDNDDIYDR